MSRSKVYPGEPRNRSLSLAETNLDITVVTSAEMRWFLWTIGVDGRLSAS